MKEATMWNSRGSRRRATWIAFAAWSALGCAAGSGAPATDPPETRPAAIDGDARVVACEHFAFLRPSLAGGIGGPQRQALKSWEGEMSACFAPEGAYYQVD